MTRVLINGIDGRLGARVAELLSVDASVSIIGLCTAKPPAPVGRAELLQARLTAQQLVELLRSEAVDVVIHLAFAGAEQPNVGREEGVQQNVLGTMLLLGACATAGVRRVVVRSHTAVYGASPLNPIHITEDRPVSPVGTRGLLRHFVEVEQFIAEFAARHPQMSIVPLRCAPIIGGWSPLLDYFKEPNPRMLAGFDPCIQLLHHEDAAIALVLASRFGAKGPINVAAEDALCLSQAIKLAGQKPASMLEPLVHLALTMGNQAILGAWPFDVSFLRHSCVVDTRRARSELNWSPVYGAAESLSMLRTNGQLDVDNERAEQALHAFLERNK
ncbi:MAG: NAD-dependent epimerase/dehydratase family protein [Candidatus Viridilinea halotolerans]|uniref:NAD-dependent epimerase/dehydratase family protein n=1 Tax=Candidatus Viridilinea halotolerans TaxID=2491704 RepID=A0A426U6P1_9CHLR|nr:MAG: NAD-dependent epimerase/dehydratase family protein [Candidatus Viridilinea halotolerans]